MAEAVALAKLHPAAEVDQALGTAATWPPDCKRRTCPIFRRTINGSWVLRSASAPRGTPSPSGSTVSKPAPRAKTSPRGRPITEGVAEGLFLDHFGQIRVDEEVRGPRLAAEVLGPHPEQARAVSDLETKLASAAWSPELPRQWQQVVAEMRLAQTLLQSPEAQQAWSNIAERLIQTGQEHEAIREQ